MSCSPSLSAIVHRSAGGRRIFRDPKKRSAFEVHLAATKHDLCTDALLLLPWLRALTYAADTGSQTRHVAYATLAKKPKCVRRARLSARGDYALVLRGNAPTSRSMLDGAFTPAVSAASHCAFSASQASLSSASWAASTTVKARTSAISTGCSSLATGIPDRVSKGSKSANRENDQAGQGYKPSERHSSPAGTL